MDHADATSTSRLVGRLDRDRQQAFQQLYRRLAPALYVWAVLRIPPGLRHRLEPEDLLQETWYRAYMNLAAFRRELAPFRAWLHGIARNVLRDELRGLIRRHRRLPPLQSPQRTEALAGALDEGASVTRQAMRDEGSRRLLAATRKLAGEERQLLILRGLEGHTYEETGRLLDITAQAAESRWRRLRRKLQERLPDHRNLLA